MMTAGANRDGRTRRDVVIAVLAMGWVASVVLGVSVGAASIDPLRVASLLFQWLPLPGDVASPTASESAVIYGIRLPRVLLGSATGAGLAVAGASMQALFRNPLADPGLIGVSGGAALGAALTIALGVAALPALAGWFGLSAIALGAFLGALGTSALVLALSTRAGRTSVLAMLLTGIAVSAFSGAVIGYLVYASTDSQLRSITLWTMGGLGGATWRTAVVATVVVAFGFAALLGQSRALDLMQLGEAEAFHLGVATDLLKRRVVVLAALMVGTLVAFTGLIGFVGLVVPHMVRSVSGPSYRSAFPACALAGAAILVAADVLARTVVAPSELPIGVLTAAIGAPVFVRILWSNGRSRGL